MGASWDVPANASIIAKLSPFAQRFCILEKHRGVAWVKHPRAEHSPYRTLAEKYLPKGAGSLLTFGFNGSEQQPAKFIDALKLFSYQAKKFHYDCGRTVKS
ncbi:PLP-dependent transferase [Sporomusa sp. KB1]|uniref:PLP-dependent transferase n=1 Tax=Sporomusa sp. KB1 TaxID=943346 RepID=UPI00119FF94D|nr:PLP-dependent transferase [Sporomusa sp. KB1]